MKSKTANAINTKTAKAIDLMQDRDVNMPWDVGRFLNSKKIYLSSEQASITPEGDYGYINELRLVVEYLADQFGGKVTWLK